MDLINTRRNFIQNCGLYTIGFSGLQALLARKTNLKNIDYGYGPLIKDKAKILDLPLGFSYNIIGKAGDKMSDGFYIPDKADGMATFPSSRNGDEIILIRNHEINPLTFGSSGPFGRGNKKISSVSDHLIYDKGNMLPCLGGTTTVVYNTKEKKVVRQFLSLVGTLRNCAGGPTPWNSWISCEEVVMGVGGPCKKDHGWCFEVPASEQARITPPVPLKAMGRFNHEAIAVDPHTGDVFMTEDRNEGLIYKFIPTIKNELNKGGILYALKIKNQPSFDTRNWSNIEFESGQVEEVEWIKMADVESPKDDLRFRGFKEGAACFARGEGMWYSRGNIYFACTNGGPKKRGQIWRINNEKLELFVEPNDPDLVDNCDNLTVSPSGDLFICEDGKGDQYIDVITPNGEIFKLAKNSKSSSELSGPTFSPDGSTLFVNIQHDGLTLAITGPWERGKT